LAQGTATLDGVAATVVVGFLAVCFEALAGFGVCGFGCFFGLVVCFDFVVFGRHQQRSS